MSETRRQSWVILATCFSAAMSGLVACGEGSAPARGAEAGHGGDVNAGGRAPTGGDTSNSGVGTGGTENGVAGAAGNPTAGQAGAALQGDGGSAGVPISVGGGGSGSPPQVKLGPAGNTCPEGPFTAPLDGNVTATLVKGNLGGELEGPVWLESQQALFFTQAGGGNDNGKIAKYTPANGMLTTFVSNVGVGGLAVDNDGQLLAASYDKRSITRFDPVTMQRTDVPGGASFNGSTLNEVNDIVMRADGNIYFSDPQYDSVPRGTQPMAFYRLSPPPESKVTEVLGEDGANGVALSPDGKYLYLGSTEPGGGPLRRVSLAADGSPADAKVAWNEDSSDGMAMDCAGNLYISSDNQIRVLSPADEVLGSITGLGNGYVTNSAFGDADHKTLYITTDKSLYKAQLAVPGFPN